MNLHFLDLRTYPIFEQLQLEEALLRGTHLDLCIVNFGSPRAIVLGISGKPELHLNLSKVIQDKIPVIQRFSGGGTVIVDEETLFITFIFSKTTLPVHPFPEPILRWSGDLYRESWNIPDFHLIENDYAIGNLKCGGNAQYIQKERWLHHTSFLWDYNQANMDYLQIPEKQPRYRQKRTHTDFLCRLKDFCSSKEELIQQLRHHLAQKFQVIDTKLEGLIWTDHRQSVRWLYK